MEKTMWWDNAKNLPELVFARRTYAQEETEHTKKQMMTLWKDEKVIGEEDFKTSMQRQHVKNLKFEWTNFLDNVNLTETDVADFNSKTRTASKHLADTISLLLECPRTVVYEILPVDNRGESMEDMKFEEVVSTASAQLTTSNTLDLEEVFTSPPSTTVEPPKKRRGRPPGSGKKKADDGAAASPTSATSSSTRVEGSTDLTLEQEVATKLSEQLSEAAKTAAKLASLLKSH